MHFLRRALRLSQIISRYGIDSTLDERYNALLAVNNAATEGDTMSVLSSTADIIGIDLTTDAQGYFAHLPEAAKNEVVKAVYDGKSTALYESVDDVKTVL